MDQRFSLIIPAAPEREVEILNSIKKLDYPRSKFNVIIVRGKNPSENRNRGASKASNEIIVFLDDDAILDKDYLKKADEFFKSYKDIDIVGGVQLTPVSDKGFAKISGYALGSLFGAWKVANRYAGQKLILNADETMLTSANLICKRKVFQRIKFDPSLFPGEDPKFISDAKKSGFNVAYNPDLKIYHRRRNTTKNLIKQIFNYGRVRPLKEKFSETLKMPFFLIPSLFLIYLVLLPLLIIITLNPLLKYLLLLPLIIYILLNLLFSIYESIKNKYYKAIFLLPIIYLIIHLSYGAGMIYGYLKKLNRIILK